MSRTNPFLLYFVSLKSGRNTHFFAALHQFYFDGNKRTGRAMMNGHLLSHGLDALSIPAAARHTFNATMVGFYRTKDATAMLGFLATTAQRAAEDPRPAHDR